LSFDPGKGAAVNNQWFSKVAVWLVIALVLFTVFKQFDRGAVRAGEIGYSEFLDEVRNKHIKSVQLQEGPTGTEIKARTTDDKELRTTATYLDRGLVGDLINNNVKFDVNLAPLAARGNDIRGATDSGLRGG
jgi:cell division protease FtsH